MPAGQRLVDARRDPRPLVVEPGVARPRAFVAQADDALRAAVVDEPRRQIDVRVRGEQLARRVLRRVEAIQGGGVAPDVRGHDHAAVAVERHRNDAGRAVSVLADQLPLGVGRGPPPGTLHRALLHRHHAARHAGAVGDPEHRVARALEGEEIRATGHRIDADEVGEVGIAFIAGREDVAAAVVERRVEARVAATRPVDDPEIAAVAVHRVQAADALFPQPRLQVDRGEHEPVVVRPREPADVLAVDARDRLRRPGVELEHREREPPAHRHECADVLARRRERESGEVGVREIRFGRLRRVGRAGERRHRREGQCAAEACRADPDAIDHDHAPQWLGPDEF